MERYEEKPERKLSRRSFKSKSATLPAGAVLMNQPGEGFFSKMRRSFRIHKKSNKFVLHHSLDDAQASDKTDKTESASISSSTDSLKRAVIGNSRAKGRLETYQDTDCATDKVVLVSRKARRCSAEETGSQGKVGDEREQPLLQTEQEAGAEASAMCSVTEDNNNDKYLDDFDPDYETLDNIRLQLRNQNDAKQNLTTKAGDLAKDETMKMSQGNESHSSSAISNIGISQETRAHAMADPSTHRGHLSSDCSDPPSTNTRDSVPLVSAFEDDLYANAQVLLRKQLQKSHEMMSDEANISRQKFVADTCFLEECRGIQQTDSSESVSPPPLPARNYSEKDIATHVDTTPISEDLNQEQISAINKLQSCSNGDQLHLTSSTVSDEANTVSKFDMSNSDRGVSKPFRKNSALIEVGPLVHLNSVQHSHEGNNCDSDLSEAQLKLPCSEWPQALSKCTNSTHTAVAEKHSTRKSKLQNLQESKTLEQLENDLLFIDEDAVEDHDQQLNGTEKTDCVRDASSNATSNTVCKDGTARDLMENKEKRDSECAGQHPSSPVSPVCVTLEGAQGIRMSRKLKCRNSQKHQEQTESNSRESDCGSSTPDSKPPRCTIGKVSPQTSKRSSASYNSLNASASAEPLPPPLPPNRTDGSVHTRQGSRRKSEGADTRTQVRPQSAQLSQRPFFPVSDAVRPANETPPPLPALRVNTKGAASGRKAMSEELPLRLAMESDLSRESRKSYRHSSAVDACRAHNDFMKSMKQLKECGWYWGPLSSDEAVSKLTDKCDGSFLVRDSTSDKYLLTISFKFNGHVHHTRIEFHKGLFSFWEQPDEHSKAHICQFIEQTVEHSKKGNFIYFQRSMNSTGNPLPIQLLYPVSRFYRVPSLQHMCRFQILCRVRRDHIDELPLPQKVKGYLSEKQYYVEMLTED